MVSEVKTQAGKNLEPAFAERPFSLLAPAHQPGQACEFEQGGDVPTQGERDGGPTPSHGSSRESTSREVLRTAPFPTSGEPKRKEGSQSSGLSGLSGYKGTSSLALSTGSLLPPPSPLLAV